MLQRKTIIWFVIAFLFLVGIVYASFFRKPAVVYTTADVVKGDVRQTVTATGTLEANDTIFLNFESTGRIKDIGVKIGQKVVKGDMIAMLDDNNLQSAADQAKANLNKALADEGANSDAIHTAQVDVENAEEFLDDQKDLNGANIDAAEQEERDAKNHLEDAQSYYDQVKAESGSGSSTTKSAKLTLDNSQAAFNQAKDQLEVVQRTADLNKTSAENTLAAAEANLDAAESQFVAAGSSAVVEGFRAAYETALNNLDKSVLRSPASGIIKKVNFKVGEVFGLAGVRDGGLTASNALAEMISSDFILEAKVSESDIASVKLGQAGEATFDAFSSDEKFKTTVVSIEPSATVVQDVVDFVVKLALDKDDPRFKDGMSSDIDILIESKSGVLSVPERAVKEENGQKFVEVLIGGKKVERKNIKTGLRGDGGIVEVVSGLEDGEKVITATK